MYMFHGRPRFDSVVQRSPAYRGRPTSELRTEAIVRRRVSTVYEGLIFTWGARGRAAGRATVELRSLDYRILQYLQLPGGVWGGAGLGCHQCYTIGIEVPHIGHILGGNHTY